MNIPIDMLFKPHESWGLFHEIGHLLPRLKPSLLNVDDPLVQEIISKRFEIDRHKNPQDYHDCIYTLGEVFADIFDFEKCFLGDFSLYIKTVWEYLQRELDFEYAARKKTPWEYRGKVVDYLMRSLFIFMYHKIMLKKEVDLRDVGYDDIRKCLSELYIDVKNIPTVNLRIEKDQEVSLLEEVTSKYSRFKPFAKIIKEKMDMIPFPNENSMGKVRTSEFKNMIDRIIRGEVVSPEEMDDPALLILNLKKRKNELSLRSNIAAILSLWAFCQNKYLKMFNPQDQFKD